MVMRNTILQKIRNGCPIQGFPLRVNLILYLVTIILTILLPVFRQPIAILFIATALSLTTCMIFIPLMEHITSIPRMIRLWNRLDEAKPVYSAGLMEEISSITTRIKMEAIDDYERIKYISGWINAAVMLDGSIVLGQTVVEEFGKEHREGILGHELGHKKGHHQLKGPLLLFIMSIIFVIPLFFYLVRSPLPFLIDWLILYAAVGLVVPFVSWPLEYEADAIAGKYIGEETVINGLRKLATSASIDVNRDSYTHPSISRRIKRLQRLAKKNQKS